MIKINPELPILVTGGSGYIASWIIRLLLEKGHLVRTTVRDASNKAKLGHLQTLAEAHPGQRSERRADGGVPPSPAGAVAKPDSGPAA